MVHRPLVHLSSFAEQSSLHLAPFADLWSSLNFIYSPLQNCLVEVTFRSGFSSCCLCRIGVLPFLKSPDGGVGSTLDFGSFKRFFIS